MKAVKSAALSGICVFAAIAATPAIAQTATATAEPSSGLEDIVVTAQKRSESLQDTPLAVSAVSAATIEARGITDISNLTAIAPSLNVNTAPASSSNTNIFIRGIGDQEPILTSDAPVSLYVDGIVLGRSTGAVFDLVDLERIEVLRGPQGTLYGRNTIGGAVNLITAKPADEFGGKVKFTYGSFNQWQARGSVDTGELADSGVKLKFSYVHREQDGYVDFVNTRGDRDPGALNIDAFRAAASYNKGGPFRADYAFDINHRASVAAAFQATVISDAVLAYINNSPALGGAAPQVSNRRLGTLRADDAGLLTDKVYGHTLTLEYDLGPDTMLRSLTGYRKWRNIDRGDELDGQGGLVGFQLDPILFVDGTVLPLGVLPVALFTSDNDRGQHQWTQELNLIGQIGDSFEYVLGGFYFKEKSFENNNQFPLIVISDQAAVPLATPLYYSHTSRSMAGFAQGTYRFNDQLSFTGGIRYTSDKKHLTQTMLLQRDLSAKFSKVNWTASVDYRATDDVLAYARVSTGYKSGGFNARSTNDGYDPEDLTSYEIGFKSELFDRRLRFNAATYYTIHKKLQLQQFQAGTGGASSVTVNAGKAQYFGVEAEVQAMPVEGLTLASSVGYIDRKYKQFVILDPSADPNDPATPGGFRDVKDTARFPFSSKWTLNASIQYELPAFDFGQLSARLDYNYRSKIYFHPTTVGTPYNDAIAGEKRGLFDGRITLSKLMLGTNEASIAVWGKNLTKKEYKANGIDFGGLGYAGNVYGEPRSFGVDLNYAF
ncbi:TonB-dependent receptor [Sphingomonas sp. KC8]|uniref:TonB-dependent receptor n=1 Tax=Sphingomonas sp. KC8 TaxID=1030157 RepID=UPI0002488A90|nr:TonB-dependent receptor [Sphingomonas sp. KC8]ARS27501.1 putative TonB-dependent receptor [Sphingomonas sp. KC8]